MEKAQIQFPRYFINKPRREAIIAMETYVNEHLDEFIDGEEITIRYRAIDGKIRSVNAIVDIPLNEEASVSVEIGDVDTLKIIESGGTEGIEDKDALWLSDNWDDEVSEDFQASDLRGTVREMAAELKTVREELALCKEALTNTLGGGDILTNSEKYELENQYESEMPEDAEYEYATEDTEIYEWHVYIGDAELDKYSEGGLYAEQRYYPKVKLYNSALEEILITSAITIMMRCGEGNARVSCTGKTLYAYTTGDTTLSVTVTDSEHGFQETKTGLIVFEKNEKPDYQTYNVKHLLVKSAESEEILFANSNYLLIGEFCWCIKEQSLYLKEQAANGTIQLFKINGQGGYTPTGETETVIYVVDDEGTLSAESSDDSINVDEDGILNLVGEVTDDGILLLNDSSKVTPPTPTPTGDTQQSISAIVDRNGILTITSTNDGAVIDRNGILDILGQVDKDGDWSIDDK